MSVRRARAMRTRGFTALEVMIALALLSVGALALLAAVSSGDALRQQERELALATRELAAQAERLRGMTPDAIVTTIGAGLTLQDTIGVEASDRDGGASAQVLRSPTLTIVVLTEQEAQLAFGLDEPPDLDGDGDPEESAPADYDVVPVRLTITWTTSGGRTATRRLVTTYYPQTTVGS
jgi:prepilin-type N-terminal cleavage/methylation domain-containing protein